MRTKTLITAVGVALFACTTVIEERITTGVYQGEEYEIRTRTLQGRNGPFEHSSAVFKGATLVCRIDSPGDCEKAAQHLINGYDDRGFNG